MQAAITINLDGYGEYRIEAEIESDEWYDFTAMFRGTDEGVYFEKVNLLQTQYIGKKRNHNDRTLR